MCGLAGVGCCLLPRTMGGQGQNFVSNVGCAQGARVTALTKNNPASVEKQTPRCKTN